MLPLLLKPALHLDFLISAKKEDKEEEEEKEVEEVVVKKVEDEETTIHPVSEVKSSLWSQKPRKYLCCPSCSLPPYI